MKQVRLKQKPLPSPLVTGGGTTKNADNTKADVCAQYRRGHCRRQAQLWTGFTVAPVKGRGHVGYLKHLRDNVCQGNRAHYDY